MEVDSNNSKLAGLREVFSSIVTDFDHHAGDFSDLRYRSPWLLLTDEWARRAGRSMAELRDMFTTRRIALLTREPLDENVSAVFEDLAGAVAAWRTEVNYRDPPFQMQRGDGRFENRRQIIEVANERWSRLEFDESFYNVSGKDIVFHGFFEDRFGHRVSANMTFRLPLRGLISSEFIFPYYKLAEPKVIHLDTLTGFSLYRWLRIPEAERLQWHLSKAKGDYEAIELCVSVAGRIMRYLKPRPADKLRPDQLRS